MIDSDLIKLATGFESNSLCFDGVGVADSKAFESVLTFMDDSKYVSAVNANDKVKAVFVRDGEQSLLRGDICALVVDDPKWYFFTLVNYLALVKVRSASVISAFASIHDSATIASIGVIVEDDVVIEPGVIVMEDVTIKRGAVIRAGAVLGVNGFEHKRTSRGMLTVAHDGEVIVEERSEIGPNNTIIKGFSYRNTVIGADTKLDALVHYAHGVQSGKRCLIAAAAMLAGHVTLGDNVWVGPKASISNRISIGDGAFVTLGSVVVRDVGVGEKVTGNFAVPHAKFIRNLKKSLKE
jgi:UDP-3-O-[3-hydroxymyristoyl] glucosamine N-acyltransferase